jgi:NAD(P)-dependent dehydrogenase (short-subunit alcohol dehydrogenase family)
MELRTVKAVVTGGASGLGRAAAERLARPPCLAGG